MRPFKRTKCLTKLTHYNVPLKFCVIIYPNLSHPWHDIEYSICSDHIHNFLTLLEFGMIFIY